MELRKLGRRLPTVSMETPITDNLYLEDILADDIDYDENMVKAENTKLMYLEIEKLKPEEKETIKLYLQGLNQCEISERLNTTQANVSRRIARIKIKLRKKLKKRLEC